MQIALPRDHRCVEDLIRLASRVNEAHRNIDNGTGTDEDECLFHALSIEEVRYGGQSVSFAFNYGRATAVQALSAYRYLLRHHRDALDVYLMAAAAGKAKFTVEAGSLNRHDQVVYSAHDMVQILPKLLSHFRQDPT